MLFSCKISLPLIQLDQMIKRVFVCLFLFVCLFVLFLFIRFVFVCSVFFCNGCTHEILFFSSLGHIHDKHLDIFNNMSCETLQYSIVLLFSLTSLLFF